MKATELRQKDIKELKHLLVEQSQQQFKKRMQKGLEQTPNPKDLRRLRRDVARIHTIINEKERQA